MKKLYRITLRTEGRTETVEGFYSDSLIRKLKAMTPEDIADASDGNNNPEYCSIEIEEYFYNQLACEIGDYFKATHCDDESKENRLYELSERFMSNPRQWVIEWLDKEHWKPASLTCPFREINPEKDYADNDFVSELLEEVYRVFWNQYEGYDSLGDLIDTEETANARYEGEHEGDGLDYEERLYFDEGENKYVKGLKIELPEYSEGDDGELHPEPYYSLKNYLDTSEYAQSYISEVDEDDLEQIVAEYKAEKDWRQKLGYTFTNAESFASDYLNWSTQGLTMEMLPEWVQQEIRAA